MAVVSAVVLNYRNVDLTMRCLRSLWDAADQSRVDVEVIVVDNSGPDTGDMLRKMVDGRARLIINEVNVGFSAGNNQGIRESRGEYVLLINNDAFVTEPCLSLGVEYLGRNPEVGIWAPALVNEHGEVQSSYGTRPAISFRDLFSEYLGLPRRPATPPPMDGSAPRSVQSVIGAFILMRRSDLSELGLLDERFFFQCEDTDLCKRVTDSGRKIVYDDRSKVVHLWGTSQPWQWLHHPYLHKARLQLFRKHYGVLGWLLAWSVVRLGVVLRGIRYSLTKESNSSCTEAVEKQSPDGG